jgi:hypothetical protein
MAFSVYKNKAEKQELNSTQYKHSTEQHLNLRLKIRHDQARQNSSDAPSFWVSSIQHISNQCLPPSNPVLILVLLNFRK